MLYVTHIHTEFDLYDFDYNSKKKNSKKITQTLEHVMVFQ